MNDEPDLGLGQPAMREQGMADDIPAEAPAPAEPESESSMYTVKFWKGVGERSVKTFAQTMVAAMGVTSTGVVGGLDWQEMGAIALAAAVASVLTSLAGVSGPQKDAETEA